jgi:hypothetical protein
MPDLTLKEFQQVKAKELSRRLQEEACKMNLPTAKERPKENKSPFSFSFSTLARPFRKRRI